MHQSVHAQMELSMLESLNVKTVHSHVSIVMDSEIVPLVQTQTSDQESNANAQKDTEMEMMESNVYLKSLLKKKP